MELKDNDLGGVVGGVSRSDYQAKKERLEEMLDPVNRVEPDPSEVIRPSEYAFQSIKDIVNNAHNQ